MKESTDLQIEFSRSYIRKFGWATHDGKKIKRNSHHLKVHIENYARALPSIEQVDPSGRRWTGSQYVSQESVDKAIRLEKA